MRCNILILATQLLKHICVGLSLKMTWKLEMVENAAADLLPGKTQQKHITFILSSLYLLLV